jgi:hypothetical protein
MREQQSTPKTHLLGYNVIARRHTMRDNKKQWRSLASAIVQNMEEALKLRDEYLNEHLNCMVDIVPLYTYTLTN